MTSIEKVDRRESGMWHAFIGHANSCAPTNECSLHAKKASNKSTIFTVNV